MAEIKQVFISSTVFDLPEHRKRAVKACSRAGMHAIDMANWSAQAANAVRVSLAKVDEADLYLGIFAHRYGHEPPNQKVPPGKEVSITEMEYRRAFDRGIPRLLFLMHEDHLLKIGDIQFEGREKLEKLKEELRLDHVCGEFKDPGELELLVFQSLVEYRGAGPVSMPDAREEPCEERVGEGPLPEELPVPSAAGPDRAAEAVLAEADRAHVPQRKAPSPAVTTPEARRAGEAVCLDYFVVVSADGRCWRSVAFDAGAGQGGVPGGTVPKGARLRVVFRPETACHVLLLIETYNRQGERFQLHHLGPMTDEDSPQATAVAASAEWQTIPHGMFLKEQVPDEVSAWRIGVLVQKEAPKQVFAALLARDRPGDASERGRATDAEAAFPAWIAQVDDTLPPDDQVRCQWHTLKIYGLGIDDNVGAFRVSGRESIIHWSEVRFE